MNRRLVWFLIFLLPVLIWSAIRPYDRATWWMEVAPVFLGVPLIYIFQRKFPISSLLLFLLWWHCVILIIGGHYSYARVPLFDWIREFTGGTRNNYDKLGHFVQGFVPAILARELLVRLSPLGKVSDRPSRWLGFLVVSVCLAFSAFYELIEWQTAVWSGSGADDFLGTQGYIWDTQTDMAFALIGAIAALLCLSRRHDRSMMVLKLHGLIK